MKTIRLATGDEELMGRRLVFPALVNWFPGLTKDQILQNSIAALDGYPQPHPDPNMIAVEVLLGADLISRASLKRAGFRIVKTETVIEHHIRTGVISPALEVVVEEL